MWLIVGLGNPGPKYELTRHNIGFLAIDALCDKYALGDMKSSFHGNFLKGSIEGEPVVLLKPETFMNKSGQSVLPAAQFFKVPLEKIVVIHDDLDLKLGELRIKKGGGNSGHNGLKDISQALGNDYIRVRLGIGRPIHKGSEADFVLNPFLGSEIPSVEKLTQDCALAVKTLLTTGLESAMQLSQVRV